MRGVSLDEAGADPDALDVHVDDGARLGAGAGAVRPGHGLIVDDVAVAADPGPGDLVGGRAVGPAEDAGADTGADGAGGTRAVVDLLLGAADGDLAGGGGAGFGIARGTKVFGSG